ncbi:MAG TPA: phytase, partial [Xanthobacteraceae bacterium]|nr:phytase [Xanthobacteraceae bacterium]
MATGPSTAQTPYLVPTRSGVSFTSILSAGEGLPGSPWKLVGLPDGIGAFDNGNGTITVLLNHELSGNAGIVRAHGSAGAFVDRLVIDIGSLRVLSAGELITSGANIFTTDLATGTVYTPGTTAFNHICSADLAVVSAFFDSVSGLGTTIRIYLTGEEAGSEGRGFAFVVTGTDAGKAFELPRLGHLSFENMVANPGAGSKTVVAM